MYERIWSAGTKTPLVFPDTLPRIEHPLTPIPEALEAATASLSVEAQKRAAKDAQKKTAKAEAAEAKQVEKLAKSMITIKRIERNKKKYVTAVIGLELFGLELKKVGHLKPQDTLCPRERHLLTHPPGGQGSRQEICDWILSDQASQRRRGDCGAGRCQPRDRGVFG